MYLTAFIAFAAFFVACEEPMAEITETDYPRAFSPIELEVTPSTFDKAKVTWKSKDAAQVYTVELHRSNDSLAFDNLVNTWEIEATSMELIGLWGETRYNVRVKSGAFNEGQTDSKWTALSFKTNAEQVFKPVKDVEVKGTSLTVRFSLPNGTVDKLTVSPGIGDVALIQSDIDAGSKVLTGLTPNTAYTIGIFNGTQKRGEVKPATKWKPTGGETDVVMVSIGEDLANITSDVVNIGKIVYLPTGYTYTTSESNGIVIAGAMTIYGDPDAVDKPRITTSSTGGGSKLFGLAADFSADILKFANVAIVGSGSTGQASCIHPGTAATDKVNIKEILFDNCDISDFGRCFIRLQNIAEAKPIGLVSLNNCYAYNVGTYGGDNGSYGFFTLNIANGGIDKISVTGSTFQKIYHSFVNAPYTNPNNPCKNVVIENCTFNDVITGPTGTTARYFLDGNNNTALIISVKNAVLGQTGPTSSGGYRFSTASGSLSAISVSGSYKTSDWVINPATSDLPSLTSYSGASTALFKSPATGDFTIKDANFAGKSTSGDPRWR